MAAGAAINSPDTQGYMERGMAMLADKNYAGCIDQLRYVDRDALTDAQLEGLDWALAEATFGSNGARALSLYRRYLALYPYSMRREQALMRVADCLMARSYAEALKVYRRVDAASLNGAQRDDLDFHTAYCLMQTGQNAEASALFARLTATKRYGADARFYQAYLAYADGRYSDAEQLFSRCDTHTAPGDMADYYLAQIYYRTARYDKALSTSRALLRRHGSTPQAFKAEAERIAGESLYLLDRPDEAIPHLRRYLAAADAPLPSALYILGRAEYAEADYTAAISHLQQATGEDDAMAQSAYLYIGQALMHEGDTKAALLAFDKAMSMPFDTDVQQTAHYNYAVARMQGGSLPFSSSASALEDFLNRYPDSPRAAEVQQYIVTGYLTDNNYEQALASIERMSAPSAPVRAARQHILYTLGARTLAAGDAASALPMLRRADALAADATADAARETRLVLGEALYRTGDYDGAATALLDYIRRAPSSEPNIAVARYDLGYTRFAQKRYADASTNFRAATERPAALPVEAVADAYNRLADTYYYASDFDRAADYYDKAYATHPQAGDYALFQKGIMQGYRRNHRAKIATLAQLSEQFPTSTLVPDALLETTEAQIQLGDNAAAIATYRRLIADYPGTAQGRKGHLQLAQTLLNDGDRNEAISTYKDIIRAYPTGVEAAEAADALKRLSAEDGTLDQYMAFIAEIDGAPKMDIAEADRLSYDAANKALITTDNPARLEAYLERYPDGAFRARALDNLMRHYTDAGTKADALRCARILSADYPDQTATEAALQLIAEDDYASGRGEAALRTWRQLEQRASTPSRLNAARLGIMRVARDLGDYELVSQAADRLLASSTLGSERRTEATYSKALALNATGRGSEARELWSSISDLTDELYGAKAAYALSQSLLDDGDTEGARTAAEALTQSGTPHAYWLARGFIVLSDVYARQGKTFEAREYLNALRSNYPGSESDIFDMIDTRLATLKK